MRVKLHSYLLERPSGATPAELLDLIFTRPGTDREFGPRFLHALLGGDSRFAFRSSSGRWIATQHASLARHLEETPFVVVDLETTGGAPERGDAIIEIGALRICHGQVVDRFDQLVDPRRRLPPFITKLTGITEAMLAEAAPVEETIDRFRRFAAGDVLVAHNARFDLSFLNSASVAVCGRPFDQPHFCTLRLARQLLPTLRKRSLDSLAGHLGVLLVDRHRAFGDARTTTEIFFQFLEMLRRRGIVRLDEALDFQQRASDGRRFVCLLPKSRVAELPTGPGIYRYFDEHDRLLYIGKAKNLRQRVSSYRINSSGHSRKTLDLIRHIREVRAQEAGSELEAALLESEEIRRHQPPYNKQRKHLPRIAFLKLTTEQAYPRLTIVSRLARGKARYFGPFHNRAAAKQVLDLLSQLFRLRTCAGRLHPDPAFSPCFQGQIGACSMPCTTHVGVDAYAGQVARVCAFFDGEIELARRELERRRDAHRDSLRFEAAARVQHQLRLIERLGQRQKALGWVVEQQQFVVLQPLARQEGTLFYIVLHGRLAERHTIRCSADLVAMVERVTALLGQPQRPLAPEDVDATVILAAWLRDRGETDGWVIPLRVDVPVEQQLPDWVAALDSMWSPAGANPNFSAPQLPAPTQPQPDR